MSIERMTRVWKNRKHELPNSDSDADESLPTPIGVACSTLTGESSVSRHDPYSSASVNVDIVSKKSHNRSDYQDTKHVSMLDRIMIIISSI